MVSTDFGLCREGGGARIRVVARDACPIPPPLHGLGSWPGITAHRACREGAQLACVDRARVKVMARGVVGVHQRDRVRPNPNPDPDSSPNHDCDANPKSWSKPCSHRLLVVHHEENLPLGIGLIVRIQWGRQRVEHTQAQGGIQWGRQRVEHTQAQDTVGQATGRAHPGSGWRCTSKLLESSTSASPTLTLDYSCIPQKGTRLVSPRRL